MRNDWKRSRRFRPSLLPVAHGHAGRVDAPCGGCECAITRLHPILGPTLSEMSERRRRNFLDDARKRKNLERSMAKLCVPSCSSTPEAEGDEVKCGWICGTGADGSIPFRPRPQRLGPLSPSRPFHRAARQGPRGSLFKAALLFCAIAGRAWASPCGSQFIEQGSLPMQDIQRKSWNMLRPSETASGMWVDTAGRESDHPTTDRQPSSHGAQRHFGTDSEKTSIISANIRALSPRLAEIVEWEADILLLQETKLAAHSIKDAAEVAKAANWTLVHEHPCKVSKKTKKGHHSHANTAATEANSGGVAAMIKAPRKDLGLPLTDEEAELHATGRWTRATTSLRGGKRALTTATYYGISGSNSCQRKSKRNEMLIAQAIDLLIKAGDQPYILMGDFNVEPSQSAAIMAAVDMGLMFDLGHMFAEKVERDEQGEAVKCPEPTFDRNGPAPGMQGSGVSRIDLAFANPAAVSSITSFHHRWDLVQVDHVPIQIILDLAAPDAPDVVHRPRGDVDLNGVPDDFDDQWDHAYADAHELYGHKLQAALDAEDVDEAHVQWSYLAEATIELAKGETKDKVARVLRSSPPRGAPPIFMKKAAAETD